MFSNSICNVNTFEEETELLSAPSNEAEMLDMHANQLKVALENKKKYQKKGNRDALRERLLGYRVSNNKTQNVLAKDPLPQLMNLLCANNSLMRNISTKRNSCIICS